MWRGLYGVHAAVDQQQMAAELERSKASVARLLKERDDLEEKLKGLGKELRQAINEKSVQVTKPCAAQLFEQLMWSCLNCHFTSAGVCMPADHSPWMAEHSAWWPHLLQACDCCTLL
jgi:hypothetical protein